MHIRFTLLFYLGLIIIPNLSAQSRFLQLDSLLTHQYEDGRFSGVVLVAEGDDIQYARAFGYADRERKVPLHLNTRFDLSSGAKLFTAVAIGQMYDQGELKFTDKLSQYFPELPFAKEITLHHLLTHSSGLGEFQTVPGFSYKDANGCLDVLHFLNTQKLYFNPGDSVRYATSNLLLLGAIVEKLSGENFPEYVETHILKPLEMDNTTFDTYFDVQDYMKRNAKYARGYIKEGGRIREKNRYPSREFFKVLSAGGMWSSAVDLLKFDKAIFSGKLLRKETVKIMTQAHVLSNWENTHYGYIFNVLYAGTEKEAYGHAGNSSGHHSFNFHYKQRETSLIILTNFGFLHIFNLAHGEVEPILFD